jgi:hypothetical protein
MGRGPNVQGLRVQGESETNPSATSAVPTRGTVRTALYEQMRAYKEKGLRYYRERAQNREEETLENFLYPA